jgi:hypothetical protein
LIEERLEIFFRTVSFLKKYVNVWMNKSWGKIDCFSLTLERVNSFTSLILFFHRSDFLFLRDIIGMWRTFLVFGFFLFTWQSTFNYTSWHSFFARKKKAKYIYFYFFIFSSIDRMLYSEMMRRPIHYNRCICSLPCACQFQLDLFRNVWLREKSVAEIDKRFQCK